MSERISWKACPHCGRLAAVGWAATVGIGREPLGEDPVEFDCVALKKQYDALRQPGRSALRDVHEALDAAVIEAFGFAQGSDVVTQLLALNQAVAADPDLARGPGSDLPCAQASTYRLVPPPA